MTRSKARASACSPSNGADRKVPVQYTWIPFPARALKAIANELISVRQDAVAAERADAASDDGVREQTPSSLTLTGRGLGGRRRRGRRGVREQA